jgi:ATP-dependent DNA helicase RecG
VSSAALLRLLEQLLLEISAAGRVRTLRLGPRDLDLPDYSERVLRGALVNAFAHRHYTMPGDTVIRQTAAYLEIENPGAWGVSKTPTRARIRVRPQPTLSRNRRKLREDGGYSALLVRRSLVAGLSLSPRPDLKTH